MKKAVYFLFFLFLVISCGRPEPPGEETHTFEIVSVCNLPGYSRGIDISGDFAYIANGQGGLQIINISDPESTYIVGEYLTKRDAHGVAVRDTFVYLAMPASMEGGLMILNVANPSEPVFFGQDPSIYAYDVVAPEDDTMYVYVAGQGWFHVEDVSTQYPSYVRRFTTPGDMRGIFMVDSIAYLACEQMGIHIFNLSIEIDSLALVGWLDTPSNARKIFVKENYAYIADGRAGLVIIDVSDSENPTFVSQYDTPQYANDIFILGDHAYIADAEAGLQVINISNPDEPVYYGSIETSYAYGVYIRDDYIYVTDRDMGLVIITEEEE